MEAVAAAVAFAQLSAAICKCIRKSRSAFRELRNIDQTFDRFRENLEAFRSQLAVITLSINEMLDHEFKALQEESVTNLLENMERTCSLTTDSIKKLSKRLRHIADKRMPAFKLPNLFTKLLFARELKEVRKGILRLEPVKIDINLFTNTMSLLLNLEKIKELRALGKAIPMNLKMKVQLLRREKKQLVIQLKEAKQKYETCLASSGRQATRCDQDILRELQGTSEKLNAVVSVVTDLARATNLSPSPKSLPVENDFSSTKSQNFHINGNRNQEWPLRRSAQDLLDAAAANASGRPPAINPDLRPESTEADGTPDPEEADAQIIDDSSHRSLATSSAESVLQENTNRMFEITDDGRFVL